MKTDNNSGTATFVLKSNIDFERGSLTRQLAQLLRGAIQNRELRPGDRIPPTRRLANELGVARGTVLAAIDSLIAEGLLVPKVGSGVFVSRDAIFVQSDSSSTPRTFSRAPRVDIIPDTDSVQECRVDFRPCRPSTKLFPRSEWKRCFGKASGMNPSSDYGDPRGSISLREEVAGYLRRSRGLGVSSDEIIITNGALHAMHLLASIFLDHGSKVVVENPGYPLARQTFQALGADIVTCDVDENGLMVSSLPKLANDIQIVYVTPSHQFPMGSRLSLGRRQELLNWAHENGVIVIEDDYDGEFRYDVPPLAPLASIENNCVFYCGTFSKILYPGIRIGYAVAPKPLIDQLARYRLLTEYAPSDVPQEALCHFISEGHFERHIHRMRRDYASKRNAVVEAIKRYLPSGNLIGTQSGLHGVLEIPDAGKSSQEISSLAERESILIPSLDRYCFGSNSNNNALVIGYADCSIDEIRTGIESLGDMVVRQSI